MAQILLKHRGYSTGTSLSHGLLLAFKVLFVGALSCTGIDLNGLRWVSTGSDLGLLFWQGGHFGTHKGFGGVGVPCGLGRSQTQYLRLTHRGSIIPGPFKEIQPDGQRPGTRSLQ